MRVFLALFAVAVLLAAFALLRPGGDAGRAPAGPGAIAAGDDPGAAVLAAPTAGPIESPESERRAVTDDASAPEPAPEAPSAIPDVAGGRGTFRGQVVDAATGSPVTGVAIHLASGSGGRSFGGPDLRLDGQPPTGAVEARTDSGGYFELDLDRHGDRSATAHADGYVDGRFLVDEAGADALRPMPITLHRAVALVGRVTGADADATTRVVARCASYHLTAGGRTLFGGDAVWSAEVAPDGRYALEGLLPEAPLAVTVEVGREELLRVPSDVVLAAGERRTLDLALGSSTRLRVTAIDASGLAQPGVRIVLYPGSEVWRTGYAQEGWDTRGTGTTDPSGVHVFEDVPPGVWGVGPARDGGGDGALAVAPTTMLVDVPAGAAEIEARVVVHRGLWLTGRVEGPDGAPVGNTHLSANPADGGLGTSSRSLADGTFRLGPLIPGEHRLRANPNPSSGLVAAETLSVVAGDDAVVVRLGPSASAQVVLVGLGSDATVPGSVGVHPVEAGGYWMYEARPGRPVELRGMAPGRYHLVGSTADGRVGTLRDIELTPTAGQAPLEIVVHPAGQVRVRYDGPGDYASAGVWSDGVRVGADGVQAGTSAQFAAPFGPVTVRFTRYLLGLDEDGSPLRDVHEVAVEVEPGVVAEAAYRVE